MARPDEAALAELAAAVTEATAFYLFGVSVPNLRANEAALRRRTLAEGAPVVVMRRSEKSERWLVARADTWEIKQGFPVSLTAMFATTKRELLGSRCEFTDYVRPG